MKIKYFLFGLLLFLVGHSVYALSGSGLESDPYVADVGERITIETNTDYVYNKFVVSNAATYSFLITETGGSTFLTGFDIEVYDEAGRKYYYNDGLASTNSINSDNENENVKGFHFYLFLKPGTYYYKLKPSFLLTPKAFMYMYGASVLENDKAIEQEYNNTMADANDISSSMSAMGALNLVRAVGYTDALDQDWFKFNLEAGKKVQIGIVYTTPAGESSDAEMHFNLFIPGQSTSVSIFGKNSSGDLTCNSSTNACIYSFNPPVTGTYYIAGFSDDIYQKLYTIQVSQADEFSGEDQNSAITIYDGINATKVWDKNNYKKDYYSKFEITKKGYIHLTSGAVPKSIYAVLTKSDGTLLLNDYVITNNSLDRYIPVEPGTYYLNLKYTYTINDSTTQSLTYGFQFYENEYVEVENNSDTNSANIIELNKDYYGFLDGKVDKNDYFKFSVESGNEYRVYVYDYRSIRYDMDFYMYDSLGNRDSSFGENSSMLYDKVRGEYYYNITPRVSGNYVIGFASSYSTGVDDYYRIRVENIPIINVNNKYQVHANKGDIIRYKVNSQQLDNITLTIMYFSDESALINSDITLMLKTSWTGDPQSVKWCNWDDDPYYDSTRGQYYCASNAYFDEIIMVALDDLDFEFSIYQNGTLNTSVLDEVNRIEQEKTDDRTPVYRMYNRINGEHLYTTDANEVSVIYTQHGWGYEGVGWYTGNTGTPVYRLYNPILGNHLYTSDLNEIDVLTSQHGWVPDNDGNPVMYSTDDVSGIPIYRVYNEALSGMHHLTTDVNEYNVLPQYGWEQEGVSMYAVEIGVPNKTEYYYVWE